MGDSLERVFQRHPECTLMSFLTESISVYLLDGNEKKKKKSSCLRKTVFHNNHTDIFLTFLVYYVHFGGTDFFPPLLAHFLFPSHTKCCMWTVTAQSNSVTSGHDVIAMLDFTTLFAWQHRKTALPKQGNHRHSCFTFSSVKTGTRNNRVRHTGQGQAALPPKHNSTEP